jgi:hypothetical protein
MHEYVLRDDNDHELRFHGELLVESASAVASDDQVQRKFVAKAYAVTGGGFVSSLEYETTSEAEEPINLIEVLDVLEEVEKFFYVFEPDEVFLSNADLTPEDLGKRPALRKRIAAAYEEATFELLEKLQSLAAPNPLDAKPADPAVDNT